LSLKSKQNKDDFKFKQQQIESLKQLEDSGYIDLYFGDESLSRPMIRFYSQPPVSLMGCNVLEPVDSTKYLIGSFSGMYTWDAVNGEVSDFFTGKGYLTPTGMSRLVSDNMVAGYLKDHLNNQWVIDYNNGIEPIGNATTWEMPADVKLKSPISLWNLAL